MKLNISAIVIGFLILGTVLTGFSLVLSGMADSGVGYNKEDKYSGVYKERLDTTTNYTNSINKSYHEMLDVFTADSSLAYITLVPKAVILVVDIIKLPFGLVGTIIDSLIEWFELPGWVKAFFNTVFVIIIVFAMIALALRFKDT